MDFSFTSYIFGFLAGIFSTLSPCVLPIIPILLSSAVNTHPKAPLAIASGLAISYAIIGTLIAWTGASFGIDVSVFRTFGAIIIGLIGIVLVSTFLQHCFASATSGISDLGNKTLEKINPTGLSGQFIIGVVLGVVWSPCVGPTLGAAIVLASQGSNLPQIALLMGVFGLGTAAPLVLLSYISRKAINKFNKKLLMAGKAGKIVFGFVMITISITIITGFDKQIEIFLLNHYPDWLTKLTTMY